MLTATPTREDVLQWLHEVKDPEIPVISVVDLGVIGDIVLGPDGFVSVELIPTFSGCPAQHYMRLQIEDVLKANGCANHVVQLNPNKPWSSNYISARGRQQLLEFGLAPPPAYDGDLTDDSLANAICPHCRSTNTQLVSPFGPTLCRAVHVCQACGETFQQFKPL